MSQRLIYAICLSVAACSGPSTLNIVDKVPPTLKSSNPSDGQQKVLPTTLFFIEFSEKMDTDSVKISATPTVLMGPPSWEFGDQVVTFTPASTLEASTQYFFTITGSDVAKNPMVAKTVTFSTASSAEACQSVSCDLTKSSQCINGECRCGDLSACTGNQACVLKNGVYGCQAPASICSPQCQANVCCDQGNRCISSPQEAFNKCGTSCADCSAYGNRVDSCSQGVCGCGTGAACSVGQRCNGGQCVCDQSSCPTGCCSNYESGTCVAYADQSVSNCGANGFRCEDYSGRATNCTSGVAQCGQSNACGVNQTCTGGQCTVPTCTAQNCANGCCNGPNPTINDCVSVKTFDKCGPNGGACQDLTDRIDACGDDGGTCGGNPPCAGSLKCVSGTCICGTGVKKCVNSVIGGNADEVCCESGKDYCRFDINGFVCSTQVDCHNAPSCLMGTPVQGCCEQVQN